MTPKLICPGCSRVVTDGPPYCPTCLLTLEPLPADEPAQEPADTSVEPADPAVAVRPAGDGPATSPATAVDQAAAVLSFPWGAVELAAGRTLAIGRESSPFATELTSYGNVSRRHAEISSAGTGLTVTDLQSVNGTFVNDQRIAPGEPFPVRPGDRVRFAATLVVRVERPEQ
ncbi:FHA domain-containing protein [Micromonospora sp. Llam0]|uniref:FHA domain-containing protein n=1 Tax=Micromonospora sp. Llam0 TaxID=2485143 RepID=UPI000F465D72|nr:FHA domain-containing protein [Micromonospora sp. Llam0]ROO58410.1 FHA domain-containing protein [Micromonospora sp. Llam0]